MKKLQATQASAPALLLRAFAIIVLIIGVTGPSRVAAYDVCADDYAGKGLPSCAHEQMFDEAMRLYLELAEDNQFSQEISQYKNTIIEGVGDPDEADPLYDNTGVFDALVTITHFWQPDNSFGQPQVQGLDPYPNAFNASQALWTRALGEYAAGRKTEAYTFLGMIAHFLGDQTIPAHAHGDTHPENLNDGDPFEEWMSNPLLNKTLLTNDEYTALVAQGLIEIPEYETADKLLWLFLNENQVAGYFASDDDEGDSNHPSDPRYPYANNYAHDALSDVIAACGGVCPTTSAQLQDNDKNTYPYYYDIDDDLSLIRTLSYVPGVRRLAALFTLWEQAIQCPVMTLTVHRMEETGFTDAAICLGATLGLDDCDKPDMYVGVVMGNRRQSPVPPGTLLESDNSSHSYRTLDGGRAFPANVTRTDANTSIAEDKVRVDTAYHFGQSFTPNLNTAEFVPGVDVIDLDLQVRDQDPTLVTSSPYGDDDIALIHPNGSNNIDLSIDLAKCSSGDSGGIVIGQVGEYQCAPSTANSSYTILMGGGRGGEGDFGEDSDDVDIRFSVSMLPDTTPPSITCPSDITIECDESTDPSNTGIASATDACNFIPTITSTDTVIPGTCPEEKTITRTWTATDASGNSSSCVQTIEVVDTTGPEIQCNAPATIKPPDAPVSFTATATDNCADDPPVEIIGYDCFQFTKKGKRIDKTESCIIEVNGNTITVVDSGGVDDNITWTVRANDSCGNVTESTCSVLVVNPEQP